MLPYASMHMHTVTHDGSRLVPLRVCRGITRQARAAPICSRHTVEDSCSMRHVPSVTLEQRAQGLESLGCRRGKAVLSSTGAHHNAVDGRTGLVGPAWEDDKCSGHMLMLTRVGKCHVPRTSCKTWHMQQSCAYNLVRRRGGDQ